MIDYNRVSRDITESYKQTVEQSIEETKAHLAKLEGYLKEVTDFLNKAVSTATEVAETAVEEVVETVKKAAPKKAAAKKVEPKVEETPVEEPEADKK
jgi:flagellar motility protein MotE (MotC chaperone)